MPFVVIVALSFRPEHIDAFWRETLPGLQAGTRAFPGVRSVRALRKPSPSTEALFVDVFESAAAGEAYFAWRQATGVLDELVGLLSAPPRIERWPLGVGDAWLEPDTTLETEGAGS